GRQRLGLEHAEQPHDLRLGGVAPHQRRADLRQRDASGPAPPHVRDVKSELLRQRQEVLVVTMVEHVEQQAVLGTEVMQQAWHGKPAGIGDVLHGQRPEAALADQSRGRVEDLPAPLRRGQPYPLAAVGPDGGVCHSASVIAAASLARLASAIYITYYLIGTR